MKFTPLHIADYGKLKPYYQNQPQALSPYSLPSIIAWSGQGFRSSYAIEGGSVIIANEPSGCAGERHLMLPVSPGGEYLPEDILTIAREAGFRSYWYVPQDYIDTYGRARIEALFQVTEQPEYDDYVYRQEDLALLKGNRYAKKRNLIHQFTRAYGETGRVVVSEMTRANAEECLAFLLQWCDIHECEADQRESIACEKNAP